MQYHDLSKKEYQALREAIADAIESAYFAVSVGEVLVLKSVTELRRYILGLKKTSYIVAKIDLDNVDSQERKALQDMGWSHHFAFQDLLALASFASVLGLIKGRLGWVAGGFSAGLAAIGVERMPHWRCWESLSESFDYDAIAEALIEANAILLDAKLSLLRIEPISEEDLKKNKRKSKHKERNSDIS
jgi:hypothetical protein